MYLMNGDCKVLYLDLDNYYLEVLNNEHLPYPLKDFIKTMDFSDTENLRKNMIYFDTVKDYLAARVLNLSRENAKVILNVLHLPQSLRMSERLKIVLACRGLTMIDNFWLKEDNEKISFSDMNLRKNPLGDAAYSVSILGKYVSATKEILAPDVGTNGMFAKTWVRQSNKIELWKTDKTNGNINTVSEVQTSELLNRTNIDHVQYHLFENDGLKIAACECLASDQVSLVSALDVRDWCIHTNKDFFAFIKENYLKDFSKMCVIDYVIANTDRHIDNWGFLVNTDTNEIIKMAPLYDHNQALIADYLKTDISDLIYDPTGLTMKESAIKFLRTANLDIDIDSFPQECKERYEDILLCKNEQEMNEREDNMER